MRITVETCPHYLTFAAEEVPDGATAFKCCPPIREAAHREALWAALRDGDIDLRGQRPLAVHARAQAARRRRLRRWPGAASPSLQLALPVVWTGARARGHGAGRRRALDGDGARRGWPACRARAAIAVGKDADLVAFAPDERRSPSAACTTATR